MAEDEVRDIEEQEDIFERFRCVVDKGQTPLRIDKYLFDHMGGTSRNRIQTAADAGNVWVNGKAVASNYKVKPLDVIQVLLDHEPRDYTIEPEHIPLNVVYEDDSVLVVNKPAGMVVHPGHGNWSGTLLNALAWYFRDNQKFDANDPTLGLVHRIDKDTSGLLLIAKTSEAKTNLAMQFFEHTTQRSYNALVWGTFPENEGTVTGALARDNRDRLIFRVWELEDNPMAKPAVTHWRVLERFRYVTLVECRLETGRTHQIRVHMKHIGHPLFADEKYGGMDVLKGVPSQKYKQFIHNCFELCPRQVLHAKTLGFTHPVTGERMLFDSEWPDDMTNLINKWRNYETTTNTMGG
ncbi:MAG: RluA family pseudouridine synthase [Paludibacter sp.]|nr:RluA family pseudouridine synthase [Bacteroidales bacterium]MCM1068622.1 RluA family pseudouridine synthase [Prevotella sp.]MCM1353286.1 RluA family pseudouridine synthase [Bacteroides sp.]MCM1442306.1 RluA family pseudouridine synthase [Muribaculum sp.]MCM1481125.1 RluA family pseudouridine synthase [Paludibacter sp.]